MKHILSNLLMNIFILFVCASFVGLMGGLAMIAFTNKEEKNQEKDKLK